LPPFATLAGAAGSFHPSGMANSPVLLGLECGGTRTVALAADGKLRQLARVDAGPANLRLVTDEQLLIRIWFLGSAKDVLSSAFRMPKDSLLRAMPPSLFETTGADVYIARLDGEAVGSVTLTYHGDTCGIWALGTLASRQRGGIGGRLLSAAMVEARNRGTRRFFLGATPAGFRLYEKLGFKTVCSTRIWVSGETDQA
jgi:GNAT superfamily N-acetyltransferase